MVWIAVFDAGPPEGIEEAILLGPGEGRINGDAAAGRAGQWRVRGLGRLVEWAHDDRHGDEVDGEKRGRRGAEPAEGVDRGDADLEEAPTVTLDEDESPSKWSRLAKAQLACTAATIPGAEQLRLVGTDPERGIWVRCTDFRDLMR